MRAIGKLPKSVLILEFIGMMLLAVALLSVSDSLSLPEPFSRPEVQREAIINSARATSSSSFLQCSSIIRITDKALRDELVTLTGG